MQTRSAMPPELTHPTDASAASAAPARLPAHWARALGWLALVWVAALLLTGAQWVDMARQWLTVSAYQHILFVPPILCWLVWNRREILAEMEPKAWWIALPMVLCAVALWLVGSLTSIDLVAQAGAVLILQTATLALLGPRVGAVLLFPIAFAVFLVPFGEEIVPPLQMLTAEMTIALTHLSGIEAEIEGVFIDTPAGLFEVAEACAGVQFVVAMVTLGVLGAKVGMSRWPRRIAFLALCLVVPILANGVRAWGIVAIAQKVGAERAGGIDHIVYGWFFFAFVVALVVAIAWRWFDRDPEAEVRAAARFADHRIVRTLHRLPARAATLAPLLAATILLVGLWAGLARSAEPELVPLAVPQIDGWTQVAADEAPFWQPEGEAASQRLHATYRNEDGQAVDLYLAAYLGDADPTAASEGAVPPETPWRQIGSVAAPADMAGIELLAYGVDRRVAWTSYVVQGRATDDPLAVRLSGLGARLTLRPQTRWLVILSTPENGAISAAETLRRFHDDLNGPASVVVRSISR